MYLRELRVAGIAFVQVVQPHGFPAANHVRKGNGRIQRETLPHAGIVGRIAPRLRHFKMIGFGIEQGQNAPVRVESGGSLADDNLADLRESNGLRQPRGHGLQPCCPLRRLFRQPPRRSFRLIQTGAFKSMGAHLRHNPHKCASLGIHVGFLRTAQFNLTRWGIMRCKSLPANHISGLLDGVHARQREREILQPRQPLFGAQGGQGCLRQFIKRGKGHISVRHGFLSILRQANRCLAERQDSHFINTALHLYCTSMARIPNRVHFPAGDLQTVEELALTSRE